MNKGYSAVQSQHRYTHCSSYALVIPHETSYGGYNVFDLSVSQSVSPVFLVNATPLKPLNRIS